MSKVVRWGLTQGCYNKFAEYFSKSLPIIITPASKQAIYTQASYVRDALTYAKEHNLPGGHLKDVTSVVPRSDGTIVIIQKGQDPVTVIDSTPEVFSLFQLIELLSTNTDIQDVLELSAAEEQITAACETFGYRARSLGDRKWRFLKI